MAITSELIHNLILLGLDGEKLAKVIELVDNHVTSCDASRYEIEQKRKSAERSRRYRQRQNTASHVTKAVNGVSSLLPSLLTESQEATKEVRKKKSIKSALPDDWLPKEGHFELAFRKFGKGPEWVNDLADIMRDWANGNDARRAKWDSVFFGFIRRDGKKGNRNGFSTGKERFRESIDRGLAEAVERDRGSGGVEDSFWLLAKRKPT